MTSTSFEHETRDSEDAVAPSRADAVEENPACISCRKRKAKCSRGQPCLQCKRSNVECQYNDRRTKAGLKIGVIDRMNQRIDTLENMFLGQGILIQHALQNAPGSLFTPITPNETLASRSDRLKQTYLSSTGLRDGAGTTVKQDAELSKPSQLSQYSERRERQMISPRIGYTQASLPPPDMIETLLDLYFRILHPWTPILHQASFRKRVQNPQRSDGVVLILNAVVAVTARFSTDSGANGPRQYAEQCRQNVILRSMETSSFETVQALVLIAVDMIGSGKVPPCWPIVGSVTRAVEYLQLNSEDEDIQSRHGGYVIRSMPLLKPPETWSESEERRRIFWNAFLLDRFCGIVTGLNTNLSSTDVQRRLPCDGIYWKKAEQVQTPFFGNSKRSKSPVEDRMPSDSVASSGEEPIGGFAYAIEATELLSVVTKFLLRYAVDVEDAQGLQLWLMKFKELDLRLLQWKAFLPPRRQRAVIVGHYMDPNLALAHVAHNAAIILLHQVVAYPPPERASYSPVLPSASSAESCILAAKETCRIASDLSEVSQSLTSSQFAYCVFTAGRLFLTHARHYKSDISPEFDNIVELLLEFSRRWSGVDQTEDKCTNLAARFAARLIQARDDPEDQPLLDMNLPDCFSETDSPRPVDNKFARDNTLPKRNTSPFPALPPSRKRQFVGLGTTWAPLPAAKKRAQHEILDTSLPLVSPKNRTSTVQKATGSQLPPVTDKERAMNEEYAEDYLGDLPYCDPGLGLCGNDAQSNMLDFGQGFGFFNR